MMLTNISVSLRSADVPKVVEKLKDFEAPTKSKYISHAFKYAECKITIYTSNVLLIQGSNCQSAYRKIFDIEYVNSGRTSTPSNSLNTSTVARTTNDKNVIGSDEVGVGDFFGGLTVAAVYVPNNQVQQLKSLGVCDSKILNDTQIISIYNQIKNSVKYTSLVLSPENYNEWYEMYQNSHIIKAVMHNDCLTRLHQQISDPHIIVVDEFASEKNYYQYLKTAKKVTTTVDVFVTQAESKYIAVACASIIARVLFLEQMKNLESLYHVKLCLGSSNPNIVNIARAILNKNGKNILDKVCKKHFITYRKVLGE